MASCMVTSDSAPRYAFTVGLTMRRGSKLGVAGAGYFIESEVLAIIHAIYQRGIPAPCADNLRSDAFGDFCVRPVHATWLHVLTAGLRVFAFDPTLMCALSLHTGEGLQRESG